MTNRTSLSALVLAAALAVCDGTPAMRVVKATNSGTPLLVNGAFEDPLPEKPAPWFAWQQGYRPAPGAGRAGSQCVVCERTEGGGEHGISQTLTLNRTNIAPFIVRGWSRAENVSGSPDNGYSLYVDIIHADGTSLWGQTASFSCGSHDWEKREFVLLPDKPVRLLTLHCLFRGHTGKVWFDDASVEEVPTPAGALLFQGVPLQEFTLAPPQTQAPQRKVSTRDGLRMTLRDTAITSLRVDGKEVGATSPSGFLARDYAADSDVYAFTAGGCTELGLKLVADLAPHRDHIAITGCVTDTTGRDRAVTLLFALPLDATGWQWGDDARRSRRIAGSGEFANTINLRCGANGKMSLYPLAAVWNDRCGLALGLDMDHPAQYRLVYHAGTRQFFIAYDFGLTQDTARLPSGAEFRFVIYRFDPQWGFRAALQKYYDIFPQHFTRRVAREGIWMPFADIARVPDHEDFGFAFQEGAPNVAFDDQHGIASFVYVEPMSHWLAMPGDAPRTYESAMSVLTNDLGSARGEDQAQMAAATLTSGVENSEGRLSLYLVKAPWCDGGVFTLNPDPDLPTTPERPFNKAMVMRQHIEAAFKKNEPRQGPLPHQPSILNPQPTPGLDGVYLDSFEMSCAELNYRREHFRTARAPLVFDREGRVCQLMIFNTWTFARDTAAEMREQGKLMFANAVLWQFAFPAPQLDVLGTEVNWLHHGEYLPDPDAVMSFRRALCRRKPYCLLMNTDYAKFTPDLVERYFQRCLFYGVWPGFFDQEAASKDPYWLSGRKWYERDRALFKKYIPLLQQLAAAGWQPVTHAACDNPKILVERFGPGPDETAYLTLLNDTAETQSGRVMVDLKALGWRRVAAAQELVSGTPARPSRAGWQITLRPQQGEMLRLSR
ncbi:MAG TPA: hypothetical protein P5205_18500 [Candidatus Paceibacterota bacterium]|nr:hypothetical protein [Verrucomicrobiota bacterium]HSA12354.1 hypothetical protein [Candidatus Paceibacterota bacterium]